MARSELGRSVWEGVAGGCCLLACVSACSFPDYVFALGEGREDCGNGIDDDGDGFADCDDSSCVCPNGVLGQGWFGPFAVRHADSSALPVDCTEAGAYSEGFTTINTDPSAGEASCSECHCGLENAACDVTADYTSVTCSSRESECSAGDSCDIALENGQCSSIDLGQGDAGDAPQSLSVEVTFRGGLCTVFSEAVATRPDVSWRVAAIRCGLAAEETAVASNTTLHAPRPPLGFAVCIRREGDVDCPPSEYRKHLFYTGFSETRDCTPCSCGEPVEGRCEGEVGSYSGAEGCDGGDPTTLDPARERCVDVADGGWGVARSVRVDLEAVASCAATGGEPEGTVEPRDVVTYCCVDA